MDDELAVEEDDEDEDMMMDTGGAGNDLQRNRSFSAITPDQLAAAIAAAQQNAAGGNSGRSQNPGAAGLFGMTGKFAPDVSLALCIQDQANLQLVSELLGQKNFEHRLL